MSVLNLTITDRAKRHIAQLLQTSAVGSLPALLFGSEKRYDKNGALLKDILPHWSLSVYDQAQAEQLDCRYVASGSSVIYRTGELTLCVPQPQHIAELDGKTLDVEGNVVWVR